MTTAGPGFSTVTGLLTETEAREKLRREGHNELTAHSRWGPARIIIDVVHESMFILLVTGCSILSLAMCRKAWC